MGPPFAACAPSSGRDTKDRGPEPQRYLSNTSWNILMAAFHDSLSAFAS